MGAFVEQLSNARVDITVEERSHGEKNKREQSVSMTRSGVVRCDGLLWRGGGDNDGRTAVEHHRHCTVIKAQPIIGINLLVCTIAMDKKKGKVNMYCSTFLLPNAHSVLIPRNPHLLSLGPADSINGRSVV